MTQAARRKTTTTRSKKPTLPRKSRTGVAAAPTDSFDWFSWYFRTEVDRKDISGIIRDYIKKRYSGEKRSVLLNAPEHAYTHYGVAASIQWKNLGKEWPEKWNGQAQIDREINNIEAISRQKAAVKEDAPKTNIVSKSPMEIVKERTSDFIAAVEEILDMFDGEVWVDWDNYSVYNEMTKADLNSFSAKHVLDYYLPLKEEMRELVEDKTDDLVEAYSSWSVPKRKQYLKIVTKICDDAQKYLLSKKAVRKPSKPRVKTADKQVAKLNYAKESSEFKITSINPTQIIGAGRLYTFNVKERIITEYVTRSSKGFEVNGTTLSLFDAEASRSIRLRKPEESLSIFQTKTAKQIDKYWSELTTKTVKPTGRINKDTILLRVMDS